MDIDVSGSTPEDAWHLAKSLRSELKSAAADIAVAAANRPPSEPETEADDHFVRLTLHVLTESSVWVAVRAVQAWLARNQGREVAIRLHGQEHEVATRNIADEDVTRIVEVMLEGQPGHVPSTFPKPPDLGQD